MDDVRAVMTAVGSERTAFFGCHLGGRLALLFAATHPELTSARGDLRRRTRRPCATTTTPGARPPKNGRSSST